MKPQKPDNLHPETKRSSTAYPMWLIIIICLLVVVNVSQLYTSSLLGWGVVILNAVVLVLIAYKSGLTLGNLGLRRSMIGRGLLWGGGASLIVVIGLSFAYLIDPNLFRDSRYHLSLSRAFIYALLIVPLHTVFVEELAFRGVLWAGTRKWKNVVWASLVSSLLFGLWHIVPSLNLNTTSGAAISGVSNGSADRLVPIVISVVATFVFGLVLCELRRRSHSLLAPIIAHWAVNGSAVLLAFLAWNH